MPKKGIATIIFLFLAKEDALIKCIIVKSNIIFLLELILLSLSFVSLYGTLGVIVY